jgi:hypothetical protein
MRRIITPPSQRPIVRLSLEEQAILQDEQSQTLTGLETDGHEIDRLVATNAGLDDTILVVSETPEFGEVDRGLVDAVADAAVAGTDADPEQVITTTPEGLASEGFVSDVVDRLKKMWEKIREYLTNAWKALVNYLSGEKRQLENVQKEAVEIEQFMEEHKSILMLEYSPENVKKVRSFRLQYQRSDTSIPMGGNPSVRIGYDEGVNERADKAKADADAMADAEEARRNKPLQLQNQRNDRAIPMTGRGLPQLGYDSTKADQERAQAEAEAAAEEARRNKPLQLQNQRNDRAMPMPGPEHIKLGYDKGVNERAEAKSAEETEAYNKRTTDEAAARDESDSRNEGERRAKVEQALVDIKKKLASHEFKFHGDLSLISTMSGVPKDFEKQVINLSSYAQHLHGTIGKTLRNMCHAFEDILGKFEGGKGQHEVPGLTERFHKDLEVIGRSIGDIKNNDGMLRVHSKGPLLGHFDVELVDHKKDGENKSARLLMDLSRAVMVVSHGAENKHGNVPLLPELMSPAMANTIKRWTEFQLGNDAANVEKDLKAYGEKFVSKIDRLIQAQQNVKVLEDEHDTYQIINGLISVCRMLDKMIIEFTLKYTTAVRLIMQNALRYQKQAAEERIRLYKEALAAF